MRMTVSLQRFSLVLILVLSVSLRLYNVEKFPDMFYDEGVYLDRAVFFLQTGILQQWFYDHPFLGWLLLSPFVGAAGYGQSMLTLTREQVAYMYSLPHLVMGLVAVIDTLLLYLLVKKIYGRASIALVASALFATSAGSWLLRRVTLDSFMTTFILLSYLVICAGISKNRILFSGLAFASALLCKLTAIFFVFPVVFRIYNHSSTGKSRLRNLLSWLLISSIGPVAWISYAYSRGELETLVSTLGVQLARAELFTLPQLVQASLAIDPILFFLGIIGTLYATRNRHLFLVLWFFPAIVGYNFVFLQYFHIIPLLPVFSVVGSLVLVDGLKALSSRMRMRPPVLSLSLSLILISLSASMSVSLVSNDAITAQTSAIQYLIENAPEDSTIISNPAQQWFLRAVGKWHVYTWRDLLFYTPPAGPAYLLSDAHMWVEFNDVPLLQKIYNDSVRERVFTSGTFRADKNVWPLYSLWFTLEGEEVEIRRGNVAG